MCFYSADVRIDALIMLLTIHQKKGGNGLTIKNTDFGRETVKHLRFKKVVKFTSEINLFFHILREEKLNIYKTN